MPGRLAIVLTLLLAAGCAMQPSAPEQAKQELAPTGKLRGGMNFGNTLYTTGKNAGGDPVGVATDVMQELANRLGVPLQLVNHATPGQVADAVDSNTWDVAILAIEQARAVKISFSPPISEIEATYAVRKDSPLRSAAQVDGKGVRIAAPEKAGYELYLTRTLKNATLVKTKSLDDSISQFNAKKVDAVASLKPNLIESMGKLPDARMTEGNFMVVNHGLGTPRARGTAGAAFLEQFVKDINASGFIAKSIERHGVKGLSAVK